MVGNRSAAAKKAWATRRANGVAKAQILPSGQRAMATNLGGKAKSGPPPTRPSQLVAALKASLASPIYRTSRDSAYRHAFRGISTAKLGRAIGRLQKIKAELRGAR